MFPQNQPLCPTVQALQKETNILFIMEPSTAPSGFRDIQARIESSD
jgi:hypothetical protein